MEDWELGYNSMKFWDFTHLSYFPNILSLKSFNNSWGISYIQCLLLMIMLRFTSSENKMWESIKNSQNIVSMIVYKIFFRFLYFY